MAHFAFRGRDRRGALVTGQREAEGPEAVASQLLTVGITPVEIRLRAPEPSWLTAIKKAWPGRRISQDDLILFSRQMHALTRAGVPINQGLDSLAQSTRVGALREALRSLMGSLEEGRDLASAMQRCPDVFPPIYASIIRVGENSGKLEESFLQLYAYLQRDKTTRNQLKSALRYPAIVVIAIAVAIGIITVEVIPAFARVYAQFHSKLPLPTRIILAVSDFASHYWLLVLALIVVSTIAIRIYIRTESGRYRFDALKLKMPVLGPVALRGGLARFARAFAMSFRSGVPVVQAMGLIAESVGNEYLGERILAMRTGIERGESLSRTAETVGLFTPLVIQMLRVGDETGATDDMLDEVATYYEDEVDYDVRNMGALIEPILIVILGLLVLILALGVFLPMWDLIQVIQH